MKGYTYIWNNTYETTNINYVIDKTKTYKVKIKDPHGCISLPYNPLGKLEASLNPVTDETILLYPNPVKDILFISYPSEKETAMRVLLYNLQGSLVKQAQYDTVAGLNQYELNLSNFAGGIYVIKYVIGSETFIKKIIVSK